MTDNVSVTLLCSCHYSALDPPSHPAEGSISSGLEAPASSVKRPDRSVHKPTGSTCFGLATVNYSEPALLSV